jgi:hypothetical protein
MNSLKIRKWLIAFFGAALYAGTVHAITCGAGSTPVVRYTVAGSEVYCLDQDGNITSSGTYVSSGRVQTSSTTVSLGSKFGNNVGNPTQTPTSTTAVLYGLKVPYVNASGTTVPAGGVVIASVTAAAGVPVPGAPSVYTATSTWIGIAESALVAGGTGYMTISGYATVLTTGAVQIGEYIVSSAPVTGYAGSLGVNLSTSTLIQNWPFIIGKAMSVGTAAGGTTIILLRK